MKFITVEKGNPEHYALLEEMMLEYISETDAHRGISTPKEFIPKITKSMIDRSDGRRILMLAADENEGVGFFYAKIDKEGDAGLIRPDWGYIMEFFVRPPYRRRGIGRDMVYLCEKFFAHRGIGKVWLTADAVTGEPFWVSCGYYDSGEVSAENGQKIFIKELSDII
ncbi:MAG: GNAT family N-acetyltransferase [Clostridia bacterium]|nr:GNAT family N-acetyltransferase [Clostridia bacterium]